MTWVWEHLTDIAGYAWAHALLAGIPLLVGLLIALPRAESDGLVAALHAAGVKAAVRIGEVVRSDSPVIRLL